MNGFLNFHFRTFRLSSPSMTDKILNAIDSFLLIVVDFFSTFCWPYSVLMNEGPLSCLRQDTPLVEPMCCHRESSRLLERLNNPLSNSWVQPLWVPATTLRGAAISLLWVAGGNASGLNYTSFNPRKLMQLIIFQCSRSHWLSYTF